VNYGAAVPTITPTFSAFANGQSSAVLTTQPSCTTAYLVTSAAGTTPATSCSGAAAANYSFSYVPGTVTVQQAAITVTASSATVNYGAAVPTITPTFSAFANGQSSAVLTTQPSCTTAYLVTSAAGTTPATTCSGAAAANYSFSYVPGTVTVQQASEATLAVTGMPSAAQAYGATFNVGYSGGSGTGAVTFAGSGACSASGTTITMDSGTGICTVTVSKAADGNYLMATGTATVAAVPAAVTATTPVIEGLSPNSVTAGSAGFTLTVTGANLSGGTVYWKPLSASGSACATTVVDAGTLTVAIPGVPACADLSSAGTVYVTVKSPGGVESAAFAFSIDGVVSSSTGNGSTTTTTVTAQAQDTTLNVQAGQNTSSSTPVNINGATQSSITSITATCYNLPVGATCSYNSGTQQLTFNVPAGTPPGSYPVLVVFTITQQVQTAALGRHRIFLASWMGLLGLPLGSLWIGRIRKKALALLLTGLIVLGLMLTLAGCGGGGFFTSGLSTRQTSTTVTLNVHP
jgi:hypothetical protein